MRRLLVVLLFIVAVLPGLTVPVAADPGTTTLSVSPNPVAAYYAGPVEATGCGYTPGDWVDLFVTLPGATFAVEVGAGPVDGSGCVDIVSSGWVAGPGDYLLAASHQVQTGQTVKVRELAEATITVV
jgi:hypothetical protein